MSKNKHTPNNLHLVLFAGVTLLVYLVLRFYNLYNRIAFAWDQNRDAEQIADILVNKDITLIGPRVVGPEGFFLAPYYTYLLAPFYALTNLDPSALMLFVVLYNLIFLTIAFLVIRALRSSWDALLFVLIWGINALLIGYDIIPWNPLIIPIGVLLVWYLLRQVYYKRHLSYWLFLGLTCGTMFHFHFQFVFVTAFALMVLYYARSTISITWQKVLALIAGFGMPFAPLVLFDLRHDFMNTKLAFTFFQGRGLSTERDLFGWTEVIGNALQPFTIFSHPILGLLAYGCFCIAVYVLFRKADGFTRVFYRATLLMFMIIPLAFLLYGTRPSEYYMVSLFPFFILIIVDNLRPLVIKPYLFYAAIVYLIFSSAFQYPKILSDQPYGLAAKTKTIEMITNTYGEDQLPVRIVAPLGLEAGFPYLLDHHGLELTTDHTIPAIEVYYRNEQEALNDQYRQATEHLYIQKVDSSSM